VLLESQKGKKKLAYQGYMYLVHSTRANGSLRWRCADSKKYKCYGSIQTDANCGSIEITNSHVHVADRAAVDVAVCRNRMRARAKTSRDKPGVIVVWLYHPPYTLYLSLTATPLFLLVAVATGLEYMLHIALSRSCCGLSAMVV